MGHISRERKPDRLSLEDWQVALRREYGREQHFDIENIGCDPIFSEFHVSNPASHHTYRVAIRGTGLGENFCSCPDFATNHLGTCKHIEWTLAHLERQPDGKRRLEEQFAPAFSEIYLSYGSQRAVRFAPGTECPMELLNAADDYFDDVGFLLRNRFEAIESFLKLARASEHDCRVYDDALRFIAEVRDENHRREAIEATFRDGSASEKWQDLLRVAIPGFQREGALFAAAAGRVIIADELGLGKPAQAIAAAAVLAECVELRSTLIVCDASLRNHWMNEIARLINCDVSFEVVSIDDPESISERHPQLIILDEAHRFGDWKSAAAQAIMHLGTEYCFAIVDRPITANVEELVPLVQFVDRYRLGPTYRFLHEHQRRDGQGRVIGYRNLESIADSLAPILLHRTRTQVLDQLPRVVEKQHRIQLLPEQRLAHEQQRRSAARLLDRFAQQQRLTELEQRQLSEAVQNTRMVCDSTFLLDHQRDHSAKCELLIRLIDNILKEDGTKITVISEWLLMLRLIQGRLTRNGRLSLLYHERQSAADREKTLRQFRSDRDARVILATDAAIADADLHRANVLVHFDIPQNREQLAARVAAAEREDATLRALSLVAEDSIESRLLDRSDEQDAIGVEQFFLSTDRLAAYVAAVQRLVETDRCTVPIPEAATVPVTWTSWARQGIELFERVLESDGDSVQLPREVVKSLLGALRRVVDPSGT